ncbi:MAG: hypothetical protein HQ567_16160 [Candidatus Nealsonbacteria bacterium]|nr:hypothetical protein [Candidatus Nealsonbacteria bacterium]
MHARWDLSRKSLLVVAAGLMVMEGLALVPATTSRGNDTTLPWYVEKETWPETYLASMNRICELERQQGLTAPAPKNDGTLPMVACPATFDASQDVKFEIDVTGVDQLFIGSSYNMYLERAKLIDRSGQTHDLIADEKAIVEWSIPDPTDRNTRVERDRFRVYRNEATLTLGRKYTTFIGTVNARDLCQISWIDKRSRLQPWGELTIARRDLWYQLSRSIEAKYDDREKAHRARGYADQTRRLLPAGFKPIDAKAASQFLAGKLLERHRTNTDPEFKQMVATFDKMAAAARTPTDFARLVRASYAIDDYRELRNVQNRLGSASEICPGLVTHFENHIRGSFLQLNPDEFEYGHAFRENLVAFEKTRALCEVAAVSPEETRKTIEFVHKVRPVDDSVWRQVDALQQELDANKNDLTAFLATHGKIKKVRRDVIFSHPALNFDKILINRCPPTKYSHNGDQHQGQHSRVGPGLTILSDWKSDHPKTHAILEGKLPEGSCRNPDLHYDAEKVVFAFCDHTAGNGRGDKRFFLYEAAIDGSWVRQLTGTERDPLETWNDRASALIEDNDPCYLPDDELVFISTRSQSYGRCHGGRYNPAWVLHRCDAAGDNIRQISFNNENEYEPSVLNDGRIVFTRWEYTNRHEMYFHMLWWCRPDGTGISQYYGNDTLFPMMVVEASAIPGSEKIVATAQGHHSYNTGTTVVYDVRKGENGEKPVTHITPETPYSESQGWPDPHYSHPYPITEEIFLVSRANHRVHPQGQTPPEADRGIYLVYPDGGRVLIYEDPNVASFSPIAVRKRRRPPALASVTSPNAPATGIVLIQNAYLTQNDPQGLIQPGSIKQIRVNAIGVQPHSGRSPCSMTVPVEIPKKVLGTVPVDARGMACFKAPADVALQLQLLDQDGMAMLTEKSFFYLQRGEYRSCVGCHAAPETSSPTVSSSGKTPHKLTPSAGPQYEGGLSFMRTVQPVLDRYCIRCHGLDKTDGDVNLVMDDQTFPRSYQALVALGDHRIGLKGYKTNENSISRPYAYFAHGSKLPKMLLDKHGDVEMDRDSYMRIIEWLDLNAQCYGDLFQNKLEQRSIAANAVEELRAYAATVVGSKMAAQAERALINVAQPDASRILKAPLAQSAGGWGQIDRWKSTQDEGYQKMAALVDACIVRRANENSYGWEPPLENGGGTGWVIDARKKLIEKLRGENEVDPK